MKSIFFRRMGSFIMALIMAVGMIAVSPSIMKANAAENDAHILADNNFRVGDNVTIKLGAKQYDGSQIEERCFYFVYTITAISGDKITISSSYYVSSVSYAIVLDMHSADLEIKEWEVSSDIDTDVQYIIGVGSDVYIQNGAINVATGKEIPIIWSAFIFTVDSIDDNGVARVKCRLTLDYINRMGITSDTIANVFNMDPENQWLNMIYTALTSFGYDLTFDVALSDLRLTANGVASSIESGTYRVNRRMTVEAYTYAPTKGLATMDSFKKETISLPAGTEVLIASYENGYGTAYVRLNNKYYVTKKINLADCTLIEEGTKLFDANGIAEGSFVKVTDLYGGDVSSFSYPYEWFFTDVEGVEFPKISEVLFKIEYAYGDGAYIVPVSPEMSDEAKAVYSFVIPHDYLASAAGTFRTTRSSVVNRQTYDAQAQDYVYERLTTFGRNTVFYSDGKAVDGKLFVRYNGFYGCVDVDNVEYVSSEVFNYTDYKVGDVVYVNYGTEKDYDGVDIFDERSERNYFGNDYASEIFTVPFKVTFAANDWLELEETEASRQANGRDSSDLEFKVILPTNKVSKTVSRQAETLGDVNLNKTVELTDAIAIQRYIARLVTNWTQAQFNNADVDGDGNVTLNDAILIQKYIAKLITRF